MAKLNYYNCLGIPEDATQAEIKRAYRRMIRVSHPDLNPNDPEAAERLKEVIAAYETLGDAKRRVRYDRINNLFGPRPKSREEVLDEKTFVAGWNSYQGQVHLASVMNRRAHARTGGLLAIILLLLTCAIIVWGIASDGFTRNPFSWSPRWGVTDRPLKSGVYINEGGRYEEIEVSSSSRNR